MKGTHQQRLRAAILCVCTILLGACGAGEDDEGEQHQTFSITSVSPEGLSQVPVEARIEVKFSQPINTDSLTPNTFWLLNEHTHERVKGKIDYDATAQKAILTPGRLHYDTHYSFTVHHSITNRTGDHVGSIARSWSFFTEVAPPVFFLQPEPDSIDVSTNTAISVQFERPPSATSVNSNSFMVTANGQPIDGQLRVEGGRATFTPTQPLNISSLYTVTLQTSILDSSGQPMFNAPFSWSFSTRNVTSTTRHIGSAFDESIRDAVRASNGDFIIGGSTTAPQQGNEPQRFRNSYVARIDQNGNQLWQKVFGSDRNDGITALALLPGDESLAVGNTDDFGNVVNSDAFITRFDSGGTQLWQKNFGSSDGHDIASGVALDSFGNIYIAGTTAGSVAGFTNAGGHDILLAKYDPNGTQLWLKQYGSANEEQTRTLSIYNDVLYLLVTENPVFQPFPGGGMGGPIAPPPFDPRSEVVYYQFDTQGIQLSRQPLTNEIINSVADSHITASGELYIGGVAFPGSSTEIVEPTAMVIRANSASNVTWSRKWSNPFGPIELQALLVDSAQNVFTGGFKFGEFDPTGPITNPIEAHPPVSLYFNKLTQTQETEAWHREVKLEQHAEVSTILPASDGGIIAFGLTHGSVDGNAVIGGEDGFMIKLDSEGVLR